MKLVRLLVSRFCLRVAAFVMRIAFGGLHIWLYTWAWCLEAVKCVEKAWGWCLGLGGRLCLIIQRGVVGNFYRGFRLGSWLLIVASRRCGLSCQEFSLQNILSRVEKGLAHHGPSSVLHSYRARVAFDHFLGDLSWPEWILLRMMYRIIYVPLLHSLWSHLD